MKSNQLKTICLLKLPAGAEIVLLYGYFKLEERDRTTELSPDRKFRFGLLVAAIAAALFEADIRILKKVLNRLVRMFTTFQHLHRKLYKND
jgi:hypothetical protein